MQHIVNMPARDALDGLAEYMVTTGPYAIENRTERTLTLGREKHPDLVLGCFLFILGVIPGLIYMGLAGGRVSVTYIATERKSGETLLMVGTEYWTDERWFTNWQRTLN